ncbi:MAG TPA: dienelactone hydrolase family protein [Casimicrobiaceae bacterium]|jgi:carboxymethylenebutenolidase
MSAPESAVPTRTVTVAPGVGGFLAHPRGRTGDGIVVLMEAYGLNAFVKETCAQFARAGYVACAPDLYHGDVFEYSNREGAMAKLRTLDDATLMKEVAGALDVLEAEGARRNAVIGFCMGGRAAFLANATHGDRLRAAISFYGGSIAPAEASGPRKPLLDRVPDLRVPQLLVYGAKDASIAPEEHCRIAQALSGANKRYTIAVFPDAPHAFATFDRDSYREAQARAAFRAAFAFLDEAYGRDEHPGR